MTYTPPNGGKQAESSCPGCQFDPPAWPGCFGSAPGETNTRYTETHKRESASKILLSLMISDESLQGEKLGDATTDHLVLGLAEGTWEGEGHSQAHCNEPQCHAYVEFPSLKFKPTNPQLESCLCSSFRHFLLLYDSGLSLTWFQSSNDS